MEWNRAVALLVVFSMVASAISLLSIAKSGEINDEEQKAKTAVYTLHAPICIIGNEGFLGDNASTGILTGSGTRYDPYVIRGWEIDGPDMEIDAIQISDSDVFFTIRDCYLHDAGHGIALSHVSNGYLFNNDCTSNNIYNLGLYWSDNNVISYNNFSDTIVSCAIESVHIEYSDENIISNNNCSNNSFGLFLNGNNNTVDSNDFHGNFDFSVSLGGRWNVFSNNTVSNNGYGVQVGGYNCTLVSNIFVQNIYRYGGVQIGDLVGISVGSRNLTLKNNVLIEDGIYFGGTTLSQWNTHDIDASNTVNGKPIRYIKNSDGGTVPDGAGQIILANCTGMVVENQWINDTHIGIQLGFSSGNSILNNTCSNDSDGIWLYSSDGNVLMSNTCSGNHFYGILLDACSDNDIIGNYANVNGGEVTGGVGIYLYDPGCNNTISDNECMGNPMGIFLSSANDNVILNNNCSLSTYDGIAFGPFCNRNNISSNVLWKNMRYGVNIGTSTYNNKIWNNTFIDNNGATKTYNPTHIQAYDKGVNNRFNSSLGYGNWWSDWQTPDNIVPLGVVDKPYNISGSANAKDYYPRVGEIMAYKSHAPISIIGNSGFLGDNASTGISTGSGTTSDPYIIEGWEISAGEAGSNGIEVQNTDKYFIIRNCSLHHTAYALDTRGIHLDNVTNAQIRDNLCSNNNYGISLNGSDNCALVNNVCMDNLWYSDFLGEGSGCSIIISYSNNNTLSNNTCLRSLVEIGLGYSNNNILNNNTCSNDYAHRGDEWASSGISLSLSNNNTVTDNNCYRNDGAAIELSGSHNLISNNRCNSTRLGRGIWIMWHIGGTNGNNIIENNTCMDNLNGVGIHIESLDNAIRNNTLIDNYYGIVIDDDGNTINNNNCSENSIGILIDYFNDHVFDNDIFSNKLCFNIREGLYINSGSNNRIWNNTFIDNNGGGVQAFDGGANNRWNSSSGYGNWWSDWQTPDNLPPWGIVDLPYSIYGDAGAKDYYPQCPRREFSPHAPIYICGNADFASKAAAEGWLGDGSEGNPYIISGYEINTTSNNGILIKNTDVHFTISGVFAVSTNHAYRGIYLNNATNARIENCICTDNLYGIYAAMCSNLEISGCNVSSSSGNGFYILSCDNVTISGCDAYSNGDNGVHLHGCTDVTVTNTDTTYNGLNGFYSKNCLRMSVNGGSHSNNLWHGMNSIYTNSSIISGGDCSDNGRNGLYMYKCNDLSIANLTASRNKNGWNGIFITGCDRVNCTSITASSNAGSGIYAYQSGNVSVVGGSFLSNAMNGVFIYRCFASAVSGATCSDNLQRGVYVLSSSLTTITGCDLSSNPLGLYAQYDGVLHIVDCDVSSNGIYGGISLWTCSDISIQGGTVSLNGWCGIYAYDCTGTATISSVNLTSNLRSGIFTQLTSNVSVTGSLVSSNGQYGIRMETGTTMAISGCTVSSNVLTGIYAVGCTYTTMSGNAVKSNHAYGIALTSCKGTDITGSNISLNTNDGIYAYSSTNGNITWNDLHKNVRGVYLAASASGFNVHHNNFMSNTYSYQAYDPGTGNVWDDGSEGNHWSNWPSSSPYGIPPDKVDMHPSVAEW